MTIKNSIILHDRLQSINSLSMVLLSMDGHYDLPDAVKCAIQDLQDEVESLCGFALLNPD